MKWAGEKTAAKVLCCRVIGQILVMTPAAAAEGLVILRILLEDLLVRGFIYRRMDFSESIRSFSLPANEHLNAPESIKGASGGLRTWIGRSSLRKCLSSVKKR
ncbi:hypothetical protein NPIL_696861 [Nephila pilipes]|uniref:Uncharacterized protein n=1 Tax=Nephila pilipes TaxID=299642 RepID=A0A8X6PZC5_NEPPI|nr:hypothetical protein NPIL_696861 [Nephila pilipes]